MDNETDGADECQPTTSNTNVRIKVSSWVTNFVSEMRTKSPAVVQRWVDSLPNENVTEIPGDTIHATDSLQQTNIVDENLAEEKFCGKNSRRTSTAEPNVVGITEQIAELSVNRKDESLHSETSGEHNTTQSSDRTSAQHQVESIESGVDSVTGNTDRRFWQKGPSILTALRITTRRSSTDSNRYTETEDLNASPSSPQLPQSDEPDTTSTASNQAVLNKSKLNEFYYKLSINKKRYNFIKERKMEAKKLLNNAKSRFLAATNWDESKQNEDDMMAASDDHSDSNVTTTAAEEEEEETAAMVTTTGTLPPVATMTTMTIVSEPKASGTASVVCDTIDMDLSADEFSRLSQSNDMLSADDEDSFNVSMPSINDGHTTHLNVSRKIVMADIGRSTSDNPRLRNKFYLADIGRSFSEHQDDEAIMIGERNISAPTSSIAIQNNNRSNGNFFERRAYSVSPTQRGLKRGMLSRDHSLSDSSRHRNQLSKGSSFQSDSSHCSSVESLLDARKPDSEAILRQLGFGPAHQEDLLSRIPKRFLKPSQVRGIDTEAFMRQQAIATNLHEQSILGYRGLTDDRMQILQRFQPHCHFANFEEEIHTSSHQQ
ncbi:uncharacterized protein LOC129578100 isoform X2 [Sitodiplosis mosellana]|uniref:uncharacterized protein LOC129578100 isoform X2 n=1 Tax=Sitodiplosis mosellana TaxID=263140 RepID=UPI0024447318|nr:uncharacterized protein LOC129578100 isoform X2 [Sitodiplosis mosellana]